ncbi:hypothetical protein [Halorussus caseinilyticus]|uniref:Uncharacterized protein n=1 Tax=Halorussus caseinilyticus TaxID=3034025 RepID=A0ABD5WF05_9EURY
MTTAAKPSANSTNHSTTFSTPTVPPPPSCSSAIRKRVHPAVRAERHETTGAVGRTPRGDRYRGRRPTRCTLRDRNVSFDQQAVAENISGARRAVERAERFRARGQQHTAISQYRVAWIHAQQALDVLDLAATPNVTITTREDMPHEENVTYAVRGRVFDVRGHELALSLSLNGANRTLNLSVNTTPGAIGTFETNVTLSRQVNRITVAATDPNRRWSPEYGGENATVGRDVLRLDGDGLPDFYELNVTGTDPLGPDSNASRTSFNESGNNVTDGAEDFDSDGETVYEAYRFGLDPLDNDTDGDDLRDGFELQFRGIDPLTNDTDNDTVRDPAEDLDNDSLSNRREQAANTNPVENDTDGDTLNDSAELANGTDPLEPDTDSDGLRDPDEYAVGTDPTVADTDGDGVLDGNETFATETTNESVGAAVNISGEGNVADTVTIQNETNDRIQTGTVANASASEVLDVDADAEFEQANLSIDYDEQAVGDESDLAVYTYDPELQTYVKLPSEVDAENDSVTGTTPHFSTFVAMNQTAWQNYMQKRAKPKPKYALNESFSDLSGWNCTGSCSTGAGRAVIGQNSSLFYSDDVSAACTGPRFPDNGECPVNGGDGDDDDDSDDDDDDDDEGTSDPSPPKQFDPSDNEKSLTIPSDTVEVTFTMPIIAFAEESNASVEVAVSVGSETRTVLELSGDDGERNTDHAYIDETFENPDGQQVSVWIHTENLAGTSPGKASVEVKRDSDGDGLTNGLEQLGVKTGTGRVSTDPYDADTDGDGLSDGEEVAGYIPRYVDGGYFELQSNPTAFDTDSDGLSDYEERRIWHSEVLDADTDGDGFRDSSDPRIWIEDNPPGVSDIYSDNFKEHIAFTVSDQSAVTVRSKPRYAPDSILDSAYWNASKATVTKQASDDYRVEFDDHGLLNEPPDRYWVNVTDAHGNERVVLIDVTEGAGAELAAAGVAVGTAGSLPSPDLIPDEVVRIPAALLGLGVAAGGAYVTNEYISASGETVRNEPVTGVEAQYPVSETALATTVTLPTGAAETGTDPRTGAQVVRGHGWQYIAQTTSITEAELQQVLQNNPTVHKHGEGDYTVIGKTDYLEEIVISIVGGTIMAASEQPVYNEDCDDTIDITKHDNPEHSLRESKPIDKVPTLREILKNPTKIVDAGQQRYYILRLGPNKVIMAVADTVSDAYHVLRTVLTGNDGGFYKTIDDAEKDIPKNDKEVVYDEDNNVDC